jgi:NAD(P)-dependent dehydrogenase (short-subunit alcohol dehydrogenase family)
MKTILVTGASRGLGLEFCKQYAEADEQVIACCRNPDQAQALNELAAEHEHIMVHQLDVTDHDSVDVLAAQLGHQTIDVLIVNAGIYGDSSRHGFGNLDYDAWRTTLETNVLGAVKVAEAFTPHLQKSSKPIIAAISSQMGSIADNGSGGSLLYRSSKAALNATIKSVALDLQSSGVGVLIFHPGWVLTDMGGPNALIDTQTSISGMIRQIDSFKPEQTGSFIKYDGTVLPW